MAEISIADDKLTVEIEGWDRIWSLRSRLEIPLAHVQGARVDPQAKLSWKALKLGGAHLPGVISAGTFYQQGGLVFWDVHDPSKAIVLDLTDERYQRLVIQVDDPFGAVARVEEALSRR